MQKLLSWLKKRQGDISKQVHPWLPWGVAAIIFTVPLYQKFPLFSVRGTFVAVRLEDFLLAIVSSIWIIGIWPEWKKILSNKVIAAMILFLGISLISVLSGIFVTHTIPASIGFLHLIRRVEYMICFAIGVSAVRSKQDLSFYIKCLGLVILIAFIYGIGQKYLSWPVIMTQNQEYSKGLALRYTPGAHLISTFAGHYDLATFLIMVSPIFFGLLVNTRALINLNIAKRLILSRIFILIILFASGWLLINSASRISIVSFMVAASVTFFLTKKYFAIPILVVVMAIWVAFSGNLLVRYNRVFEVGVEQLREKIKINQIISPFEISAQEEEVLAVALPQVLSATEDRSTNIRLNVEWPRALRAFVKNPLLGTGFSSITLATDNDYLRLLGEVGILGFLAFVLILIRLVIELLRKLPLIGELDYDSVYYAGMMGAFPGVLINAVFIDVFEASKFAIMFWLLMGFVLGQTKKE